MALGFVLAGEVATWAGADTEPVIVVPGRPGVPIIIDGQDVRGAVIEGEWGLARGHTGITIIKPWPGYPWPHVFGPHGFGPPRWVAPAGRYYPTAGKPPRVGRLEIIPPADRALPPPAKSFERVWGTESAPLPATVDPLESYGMPGTGSRWYRNRRRGPSAADQHGPK